METQVKARPILFSGAMVRALLAGTKTQTRRVVKAEIQYDPAGPRNGKWYYRRPDSILNSFETVQELAARHCPYGKPGGRLWVRETWAAQWKKCGCYFQPCDCTEVAITYIADGASQVFDDNTISDCWQMPKAVAAGKNGPCLFMPRFASRILLEITAVRCERLQDISEADAVAEGLNVVEYWQHDLKCPHYENYQDKMRYEPNPIDSYRSLWQKINGPDSWAANPWVWVVEFKRVEA